MDKLIKQTVLKELQMANKSIKKCSTPLTIKEMQIKTTSRFYLTPVTMAVIKKTTKITSEVAGGKNSHTVRWECKLVQSPWKSVWWFLQKLKIELSYNSAAPFLGTYPKECKSAYNRDACIPMFIAPLFTITKLWNQFSCPSTDTWIKKNVVYIYIYIYTMKY
jgi:hypothetical protein